MKKDSAEALIENSGVIRVMTCELIHKTSIVPTPIGLCQAADPTGPITSDRMDTPLIEPHVLAKERTPGERVYGLPHHLS